ncbi:MAG: alkaline phosphatase, partial [Candidatus Poribacteria bacterium]
MSHKKFYLTLLAISFVVLAFVINKSYSQDIPKNIILMISDGCGHNHINATSLYQYGNTGTQVYEKFPIQLWVSTYSARDRKVNGPYKEGYEPEKAWSWFEYVKSGATDSAASVTAMAT